MCKDAPSPDPLIGESAKLSAETAKDALDWYKNTYATEIAPRMKRDQELREGLVEDMRGSMRRQQEFADEQNQYYKSTFRPVEEQTVRDAMNYDSQANIDRRMGIAAANVNQQFSNAAGQQARTLSRYGINPNSSAFARENAKLTNQQALAAAGAQTGAAFDTMDRGIALRAGAANFGRNMPNTAAQYYSGANASGQNAGNVSAQGMSTAAQGVGTMGQGYNSFFQGNTAAGNLMLGDFNARMQGYNAQQAATGQLFGAIGTYAGLKLRDGGYIDAKGIRMADGGNVHRGPGKVDGPGGPVDDKVPAMLSDGEYVIPADVVKAKGVEFFEKLKQKYHTPAAQQRMGVRRS